MQTVTGPAQRTRQVCQLFERWHDGVDHIVGAREPARDNCRLPLVIFRLPSEKVGIVSPMFSDKGLDQFNCDQKMHSQTFQLAIKPDDGIVY
jgi:hypothetical protein